MKKKSVLLIIALIALLTTALIIVKVFPATHSISGKIMLPNGTKAPKGGVKIHISSYINPNPNPNRIEFVHEPVLVSNADVFMPEGESTVSYTILIPDEHQNDKPNYVLYFKYECMDEEYNVEYGDYMHKAFNFSSGDVLNADYTLSKGVKQLVRSIPTCTMSFTGGDDNWDARFIREEVGGSSRTFIGLTQNFFDFNEKNIKYKLETSAGIVTGTIENLNTRMYSAETDVFPKKDEILTLTIEYGNRKSIIKLRNQMTAEIVPAEKVLIAFMKRFNVSEKEVAQILYSPDRKEWHLLTALGYTVMDAKTGIFRYIITGRDEMSDGSELIRPYELNN